MIRVIRMMPVLGVGVMSLTYLITGNPITAVLYGKAWESRTSLKN
jgi:hypothetical protein